MPFPLENFGQCEERIYPLGLEARLHAAFAAKRIRGEWFRLDDFDIAEWHKPVRLLAAGSPPESKPESRPRSVIAREQNANRARARRAAFRKAALAYRKAL